MKKPKTKGQLINELIYQRQNNWILQGMMIQRMADLHKLKNGYGWDDSEIKVFDDMDCVFLSADDIFAMIDELKEIGIDVLEVRIIKERQ